MSRDERTTPPTSKTTWLARTPMRIASAPACDDARELLQRAGRDVRLEAAVQRRLERGLLDAQAVGVRRDHPQVRARRRHEDAGEDRPRLVARGRARDLGDGLHERLRPGT